MHHMVCINNRTLTAQRTGVQRYLTELLARWDTGFELISPAAPLRGVTGHLWEQLVLPRALQNRMLFSPSNTGPLLISNQVVTIHDVSPLDHPEWQSRRFAAWYRFLTPRLARRVKHVIVDSEFTKSRLLDCSGILPEKVTVIPCGVDSRFHPRSEEEVNAATVALSLPSTRYILSVGSLEHRKNLNRLLAAWSTVQRRLPDDLWLVIAGAKGSSLVFRDVAPEGQEGRVPRVHFTGYVADEYLPALYSGALAFAYMSVYEGFGLPPLEAMAAGIPVLTGNMTSIPEVVADAGLMVDPFDVEAIADGLNRLAWSDDWRKELRRRGLNRVKLFSWDTAAAATWKLLVNMARQ